MGKPQFFQTFMGVALSFTLCAIVFSSALAAEKLRYDTDIPRSSFERIKSFYTNRITEDHIAATDLNNDGLNEYILRSPSCTNAAPCGHKIVAERESNIVVLGDFKALNVMLGNHYAHGIRNLLVFDTPVNDFAYSVYTWHPEYSSYRKAKQ